MAQEIINVGAVPDDGNGDPLRTAFQKCNNNFDELYANIGGANIGNITFSGSNISSDNDTDNLYVTAHTDTGASLNSDTWSQLYWCPDVTGNTSVFNPDSGGDNYTWAYVDSTGFRVAYEDTGNIISNEWRFTSSGVFDAPGDISAVGNISGNFITADGIINANAFISTVFATTNLPSAGSVGPGARSFVNDSNTTTFYANVAPGGSNTVPVFSDGASWRVG